MEKYIKVVERGFLFLLNIFKYYKNMGKGEENENHTWLMLPYDLGECNDNNNNNTN